MLFRVLRLTILAGVICGTSSAGVVYNETINGDLSNSGLNPTVVTVALGSNSLFGTTGNPGTGIDRDYLTLTVPNGLMLSSITVLPGTFSGGGLSFLGIEAGPQITLPANTQTAAGLLGWWHYSPVDIGHDILALAGIPASGSSGFTGPLGPGSYSFWIQDFNAGSFAYGFDFQIDPVPEPASWCAALLGSAVLLMRRRVRR